MGISLLITSHESLQPGDNLLGAKEEILFPAESLYSSPGYISGITTTICWAPEQRRMDLPSYDDESPHPLSQ